MSTLLTLGSNRYFLDDKEQFVRIKQVANDPETGIVTYEICTVWTDGYSARHECRTVTVSLEYQPNEAACLASFTAELQPAQMVYATNPDRKKVNRAVALLIGGDDTRYFLSA